MTFYVENLVDASFPFDEEEIASRVCERILELEKCPYEAEVNVFITDNEGIRRINNSERGIDKDRDVLSFPNLKYDKPSVFDLTINDPSGCTNPETDELILGDIVVSADRVYSQAAEYGHLPLREYAFLIAHSMYHLCVYDHMDEEDARLMEKKQEEALNSLDITRRL